MNLNGTELNLYVLKHKSPEILLRDEHTVPWSSHSCSVCCWPPSLLPERLNHHRCAISAQHMNVGVTPVNQSPVPLCFKSKQGSIYALQSSAVTVQNYIFATPATWLLKIYCLEIFISDHITVVCMILLFSILQRNFSAFAHF